MLDYARQLLIQYLSGTRSVVFISNGPAGVQAGDFPCEAAGDDLYVLLPQSSDHLYNLEENHHVTLLARGWELKGRAQSISIDGEIENLGLLQQEAASWCVLLQVEADVLQVRQENGWGYVETIDVTGKRQGS